LIVNIFLIYPIILSCRYVSAKSSETKLKGSDHLTHQISDQNRSRQTSGDDEITHTSSIYMKRILSYLSVSFIQISTIPRYKY
jgi:hypothetical protein